MICSNELLIAFRLFRHSHIFVFIISGNLFGMSGIVYRVNCLPATKIHSGNAHYSNSNIVQFQRFHVVLYICACLSRHFSVGADLPTQ